MVPAERGEQRHDLWSHSDGVLLLFQSLFLTQLLDLVKLVDEVVWVHRVDNGEQKKFVDVWVLKDLNLWDVLIGV